MLTRAVLFDLDDTLVVEEDLVEKAFLTTCRLADESHGLPPRCWISQFVNGRVNYGVRCPRSTTLAAWGLGGRGRLRQGREAVKSTSNVSRLTPTPIFSDVGS